MHLDTACRWVPHVFDQRARRERGVVGAALVQPPLHRVQLVLHRGAVPLRWVVLLWLRRPVLLLRTAPLVLRVLRVLRVLLRRGRGWPVVEAGRGDGAQAELGEIAHALGVRRGERLRKAP